MPEWRRDYFRAGHAHAGVLTVLSLALVPCMAQAELPPAVQSAVRWGFARRIAARFGRFFPTLATKKSSDAPNRSYRVSILGAVVLGATLVTLGVGLLRAP